jgi:hypothetical protein
MDGHMSSPTHTSAAGSNTTSVQQSPTVGSFVPPVPQAPKTASTDVFLRDLNLVAEAAKRAEMAVLMRDLESFGLS